MISRGKMIGGKNDPGGKMIRDVCNDVNQCKSLNDFQGEK